MALRIPVVALLVLASTEVAQAGLNAWTTTGPEGGRIKALAVDPQTPGVLYAGTFGGEGVFAGGIFKSSTDGRIWVPLPPPVEAAISDVAIDPQRPATLYAGTNAGLYKSTDGGMTWHSRNSGLSTGLTMFISSLAIDPRTPTTVFAGTGQGVFKTIDGGASWQPSLSVDVLVLDVAIDPRTPTTIYAGTLLGVFKSIDGGAMWNPSNTGLTNLQVFALAIDPKTPGTLYTVSQGADFKSTIFKSNDGGASWSLSNTGLINAQAVSLAINTQTPEVLYAGTLTGVFKSTDRGATWHPSSAGLPVSDPASVISVLAIDPRSSTTLYAGSQGGGVFQSTDAGASWSPTNVSLRAVAIGGFFAGHPLAVDPQRPNVLYASTENALFKSTTGGASWVSSASGLPGESLSLALDPQTPTTVYAAPNNASPTSVFKSTDGGATWSSGRTGLPNDFLGPMAVDPSTPATLYVGTSGTGVFKSTNGGMSWQASNSGLPGNGVADIAIDPRTPASLYTATSGGGIFKSTDRGASWRPSNTGLTDSSIAAVVIDPKTPATLYAATGGGVFKSLDGGASWRTSTSGLPADAITALAIDPQSPATLYAGTRGGGLFKSTNGGTTWSAFSGTGLGNLDVNALVTNSTGSCLHAGTRTGVFSFATRLDSSCLPPPPLVAALSTTSHAVAVGTAARTFATVGNLSAGPAPNPSAVTPDGATAVACGITQLTGAPTPFTFQAVDPTTGQPIAPVNTPVDIPAATTQPFMVTLIPSTAMCALDIHFGYNCSNTALADLITGVNTLLLTAGATAGCGLSISVSVNQPTFIAGQTLLLGGSVANPGLSGAAADFYVGVLRPDNSIQFFTSTGPVEGNPVDLRSFQPLAVNVPLATPFAVSQSSVFTHQWTAGDLPGTYLFFVAAVKTGALAGGTTITDDQILGLATTPYTFP